MSDVGELLKQVEAEARRAPFPVDEPVYRSAGRDPMAPILYAGSLDAPVCSFGRDLGRDEVRFAQPQVGAAGRQVRDGVLAAVGVKPPPDDRLLETALQYVLLSNTVPYKPPGNKAYADSVKERFRPFIAGMLACHWRGDTVITLGTEAFQWFAPYAGPGAAQAFWKREDRYEAEFPCLLSADCDGRVERPLTVCPLPHPSPLNQRWVELFPELLRKRLAKVLSRAR